MIFLEKIAIFVTVKKITHLDFQNNLKRECVNAKLETLKLFQNFSTLILANVFFTFQCILSLSHLMPINE